MKPNFLLIGAQKAGTTWLARMLEQHPDVFTPETKEIHFFDMHYERGAEWYRAHFADHAGERAVGESTPYFWVQAIPRTLSEELAERGEPEIRFTEYRGLSPNVPELIHRYSPEAKLVVLLRNPVDRALSALRHHMRMRRIAPSRRVFEVGGQYGILGAGFYHAQLERWQEYFPQDRVLVLVYEEDVMRDRERTLRRVFAHLGVDKSFVAAAPDARYNAGASGPFLYANYYAPRLAAPLFESLPRLHALPYPRVQVADEDRHRLQALYDPENRRLETLLGRNLSAWNEPKTSET